MKLLSRVSRRFMVVLAIAIFAGAVPTAGYAAPLGLDRSFTPSCPGCIPPDAFSGTSGYQLQELILNHPAVGDALNAWYQAHPDQAIAFVRILAANPFAPYFFAWANAHPAALAQLFNQLAMMP